MELTEKERLILVAKKEEILKITLELLDIVGRPKEATTIKKDITSILSLLSTIASYAKPRQVDLGNFQEVAHLIFLQIDESFPYDFSVDIFCNAVNSIQFDFTRRDIIIRLPKIDLALIRKT